MTGLLVWPISGGVIKVSTPDGLNPDPGAASGDASVIIGGTNGTAAARWDVPNYTPLASSVGHGAQAISQDASVIYGLSVPNCVFWTSPSVIGTLPPLDGYTSSFASSMHHQRGCSDDGSIVYGWSVLLSRTITKWVNGVPFAIESPANMGPACCSQDGSFVTAIPTPVNDGGCGYWKNGVFFPLALGNGNAIAGAGICDGAGTIAYGGVQTFSNVLSPVYWDDLGSSDLGVYGTMHFPDLLGASTGAITHVAETGNVFVGILDYDGVEAAVRWHGTVGTLLDKIPGFGRSIASACSGDGSIVVGYSDAADGTGDKPVYWDATGAIHLLPLPPDDLRHLWEYGQVFGVTRDGTMAWGIGDYLVPTSEWTVSSDLQTASPGGAGDVWIDNTYVDFDDATVRNRFQNPDGSWLWLGSYGAIATGSSPLIFLTVQPAQPPSNILFGYGQNGGQSGWDLLDEGVDPTTGLEYPPMSFDICETPPPTPTSNLIVTDINVDVIAPILTENEVTLRWSDDAGASWSNGLLRTLGAPGEYFTTPTWYRLGMSRNRILELSWSGAGAEALQGVFVNVTIAAT